MSTDRIASLERLANDPRTPFHEAAAARRALEKLDPTRGLDQQTVEDINTAATIGWQQALKREGKAIPEAEVDPSFLETPRGQKAWRLMKAIGINPKSPWAPPLWDLNAKYRVKAPSKKAGRKSPVRISKKTPRPSRPPAPRAAAPRPAKKASTKVRDGKRKPPPKTAGEKRVRKESGFIEKILSQAGRVIAVTVATDDKTTGNWTARGETQMRAVLKKALAQAHMLASQGYRTCIAVAHEHGGVTVECWPQ